MTDWGKFPRVDDEIIYDVTLDKPRQIGFASIAVCRELVNFSNSLESTNPELASNIQNVSTEMRYSIIGNTTKSLNKFNRAIDYILSHSTDNFPAYIIILIELCERIVNAVETHQEFIDDLLAVCAELKIYSIEDSLDKKEA